MPQYKVEALRTIRAIQAQHERSGHDAQAEQMRKIGDQVEAMAEALHEIADLDCTRMDEAAWIARKALEEK